MVRTASTKPHIRRQNASRKVEQLKYRHNPLCSDFNLNVSSSLVRINARVLPPPLIQYQQGTVQPANGQWRAKQGASSPAEIFSWAICCTARLHEEAVKTFARDLISAFERARIEMHMKYPVLYHAEEHRLEREMDRIASEFSKNTRIKMRSPRLQLLVIIRERQETAGYNMIKRAGDLRLGIATQVCLAKHCGPKGRGRDMYCDNVVLKINAKLGGHNGLVAKYSQGPAKGVVPDVDFLDVPHVVLGADVTHPMPGGKGPSIAALVCTRDRQGSQFSAALRSQTGRKEMISDIGDMFKEVYRVWYDNFKGKVHARKIIMFRDGVSEGQFQEVMQEEVAGIRRACVDIGRDMRPKITYIIVTKRHHTRFFPTKREEADRSGNIPPGTVVDTDITSDEFYDFYINSHAGIQGTNKPSKYTVLIDENNIPTDALQGYIYRLTHSFARCNRPVSMVHSAYYAHLLAFRGRAYLGDDGSDSASQASSGSSVPPVPRVHPSHRGRLFFC
ncbi:Protein argonaute-3 [Gracilariopsis chorda]|uniref:Protein argonaute-3 n=1 Tax=Gracilariopsis chorda TaxID=448386 RepID=A0A2V3IS79_9FLOR|nr:Protein argonaute-3 [Gracilariopsis chorda]|eukprot:PXF44954.1 Protein argonaute-3 [Gracilariopsis chorda]